MVFSTQARKVTSWGVRCAIIDAQGFFGYGYFVEDKELDAPNFLKTAERKKILSNIESLGLLSAAEKAGITLSKVHSSDFTILIWQAQHQACMALHSLMLAQE